MALTCPNGHTNEEGNRFCEQCGAPLQPSQASNAPSAAQAAPSSGATSSTCPVCGQENVPGTAFCDNCGAELPPPLPAATHEPAATSAPVASATSGPVSDAATIPCPQCGTPNDPTNRFCDNCGAKLSETSTPAQDDAGQAGAPAAQPDHVAQMSPVPEAPDLVAAPAVEATVPPTPVEATAQEVGATGGASAAPAAPEAPAPQPAETAGAVSAERQRLEETIRTQQQVIGQLEQMQAQFGAATPPAIVQGLDEARRNLAQAESELQALPSQSAVDPAERQRLEEMIRTQQQMIGQLEQMQAQFGAATPPAIVQGLDEARRNLAQAESELQALTGTSGASAAPAAPEAPPLPVVPEAAAPQAPAPVSQPAAPSQPAPTPSQADAAPQVVPASGGTNQLPPAPEPQVSGPRFVTRDGDVLSLPRTGGEIVIGRDDPISGIHPAVDLTPHGGEAGGVSRRHAVLREHNGQWLLTDLNSTNYTRIDGNRLAPDTPTPLRDGARVQFGRLEFDFRAS